MAILTDSDRKSIRGEFAERLSRDFVPVSVTKADLKTAVDSIDQWVEDNKVSFNTALPEPAKSNLTAPQKAELLKFVVTKRFQRGS